MIEKGYLDTGSAPESLPQDVHAPNLNYPPIPYPPVPLTMTPPVPTTSSASNGPLLAQAMSAAPAITTTAHLLSSMNANWTQSEALARKRVADSYLERQPIKKPRKPRTCGKCGKASCPGKQMVSRCRNPCRDCGRVECRGRNTKFPTRLCFTRDD